MAELVEQDIHLEISGRQCGKTTRLIDDMVDEFLFLGKKCLYITISENMTERAFIKIKEKVLESLPERLHSYLVITGRQISFIKNGGIIKLTSEYEIIDKIKGFRFDNVYFDEFDFIENNTQIMNIIYPIVCLNKCKLYFVTSPAYIRKLKDIIDWKDNRRKDLLLDLLLLTDEKYEQHLNTNMQEDEYYDLNETKGQFFRFF